MNKKILTFIFFIMIVSVSLVFISAAGRPTNPPIPRSATVAIYNGSGTWRDGIVAFEHFLTSENITWSEVTASQVNYYNLSVYFKGIYLPGGYNYYNGNINVNGTLHIKDLVNKAGGAYIGSCAGSYYASDKVQWDGGNEDYPLDFFNGTAWGPIDSIAFYPSYNMTQVNVNQQNIINNGLQSSYQMLYYGGPVFYQNGAQPNASQEVNVLASWDAYNNENAALNFEFGKGKVLLLGPHGEIEENSERDGTNFGSELIDSDTDWSFLNSSVRWALNLPMPSPDTTSPVINSINDSPDPLNAGQDLKVEANVTDDTAVNSVWVNLLGTDYPMQLNQGTSNQLFFDGFESGSLSTNNWDVYGTGNNNWSVVTTFPYQGTYHSQIMYTGSSKYSYLEVSIDTTGYSNIDFSYYRQLLGLDSVDGFEAQWYTGSSWSSVETVTAENDASYVFKSFSLPSSANNNPNFKIRFMCEANAYSEGCRLDNVKITANVAGTGFYEYIYNTTSLASGIYNYTVYANDTSNNQAIPSSGTFTIN